jgi:hypothetical protein
MFGRPEEERDDMELPPREGVSVGAAMMMDGRGAAGAAAGSGPVPGPAALPAGVAGEEMEAFGLVTGRGITLLEEA